MNYQPTGEPATVKVVKDFFEEKSISKFTAEWKELSEKDKDDIKKGIGDGTLDY